MLRLCYIENLGRRLSFASFQLSYIWQSLVVIRNKYDYYEMFTCLYGVTRKDTSISFFRRNNIKVFH